LPEILRPVFALLFAANGTECFLTPTDDPESVRHAKALRGESLSIAAGSLPTGCFRTPYTGNIVWEFLTFEELTELMG
jgi:hypothetical protein